VRAVVSLLPTGHVSAALGVVYMLALELRKTYDSETTTLAENDPLFPTIMIGGDDDNFNRGAEAVRLDLKYIGLVNKEDDLQEHGCLQLIFAAKDGRKLPRSRMNLLIEPPYTGFFSSRRRTIYSREIVSFHIDEVQTVTWFRRQLISGNLSGFITDEGGQTTAIPPQYWATDRCSDVLKYDVSTLVRTAGAEVFGRVSFPIEDIDKLYANGRAVNDLPSDADAIADAEIYQETSPGRPSKFDGEAFLIEAAKVIHDDAPKSQAELIRRTLDAYATAGHQGGRPGMAWAKKKIAPLWRRLGHAQILIN
jgi:hypothetical protein